MRVRSPGSANRAFTFIEVMVAMLIFVLAVLAAVNIAQGSVRATRDAKEIATATWLLQGAMVELETRLESEGIEKGCEKKREGKFEAPNERFSWTATCTEIDFQLSESAAKLAKMTGEDSGNEPQKEDLVQKMILKTASDYLTKNLRELHAEILWTEGKTKRKIDATTHYVKYDDPLSLGGVAAGAVGGAGGKQ